MTLSPVYRPHQESPATAQLTPLPEGTCLEGAHGHRFEVVSRGDFVPGHLYLPPEPSSAVPLVIAQHDLAGSKTSADLGFAASWLQQGCAVAMMDLPLHGERSSPKLSARLVSGIDRIHKKEHLDLDTHALVEEFARQSTSDLIRVLDALSKLDPLDAHRVGFVGLGLGAIVGSFFLSHDPRPQVAVLALAGGRVGPAELDPAEHIRREPASSNGQRSLLVVAAEDDERVSMDSVKALFDAAPDPKDFLVSPGGREALDDATQHRIVSFVREALER